MPGGKVNRYERSEGVLGCSVSVGEGVCLTRFEAAAGITGAVEKCDPGGSRMPPGEPLIVGDINVSLGLSFGGSR